MYLEILVKNVQRLSMHKCGRIERLAKGIIARKQTPIISHARPNIRKASLNIWLGKLIRIMFKFDAIQLFRRKMLAPGLWGMDTFPEVRLDVMKMKVLI